MYRQKYPITDMEKSAMTLNDPIIPVDKHLDVLRMDVIEGILLVTQLVDEQGGMDPPFITILLATPLVATYNNMSPEKLYFGENLGQDGSVLLHAATDYCQYPLFTVLCPGELLPC
jgi:hypothetical protein